MDSMTYSNFGYYKPQDSDLDDAEKWAFPFIEGSQFRAINAGIDEPACQVNYEDWLPGPDIWWSMNHDEVHVVTKGRAEVEYWLLLPAAGCPHPLARPRRRAVPPSLHLLSEPRLSGAEGEERRRRPDRPAGDALRGRGR